MLTGLMQDLSGCSPPKFFCSRLEPDSLRILPRTHFDVSFLMSFTTCSRFSQLRMSHLAGHGRCPIMLFAMLWFLGAKRKENSLSFSLSPLNFNTVLVARIKAETSGE